MIRPRIRLEVHTYPQLAVSSSHSAWSKSRQRRSTAPAVSQTSFLTGTIMLTGGIYNTIIGPYALVVCIDPAAAGGLDDHAEWVLSTPLLLLPAAIIPQHQRHQDSTFHTHFNTHMAVNTRMPTTHTMCSLYTYRHDKRKATPAERHSCGSRHQVRQVDPRAPKQDQAFEGKSFKCTCTQARCCAKQPQTSR